MDRKYVFANFGAGVPARSLSMNNECHCGGPIMRLRPSGVKTVVHKLHSIAYIILSSSKQALIDDRVIKFSSVIGGNRDRDRIIQIVSRAYVVMTWNVCGPQNFAITYPDRRWSMAHTEGAVSKVGRPPTYDRDLVLDTALCHFWQEGYTGARLDDICRDARISKPSLYGAFGDKDALYRASLDRYAELFTQRVIDALETATTPGQVFQAYLGEIVAILGDSRNPMGCLRVNTALECAETAPELASIARRNRQETRKAVDTALKRTGAKSHLALSHLAITLSDGLAASARAGDETKVLTSTTNLAIAAVRKLTEDPSP